MTRFTRSSNINDIQIKMIGDMINLERQNTAKNI